MKFGSLFSGIGGFDLGFERAGMSAAWNCEIDDKARAVLARHWPNVEQHTDVRAIGAHNLEPVDLICGGFPCQDLSVAGKRAGLAGERSGLWFEFHRILSELAPGWVVIENVPGLLSSNSGRDFAVVLRGLVELGYGVCWRVLDAQYFGVAQRRRRVFIVGHLGDGRAAEVLFEREGGPGDTAPRREAGQRVAGTLESGANRTGGTRPPGSTVDNAPDLVVAATLNSGGNSGDFRTEPGEHLVAFGGNNTAGPIDIATAQNAHGGTGRLDFESETFIAFAQNTRDEVRLVNGDGAIAGAPLVSIFQSSQSGVREVDAHPTLDSHNGSRRQNGIAGAAGVRRLTPVECERLQGFPDGWTGGQADSARYKQLGNAVAVPCAEWIGRRITLFAPEQPR